MREKNDCLRGKTENPASSRDLRAGSHGTSHGYMTGHADSGLPSAPAGGKCDADARVNMPQAPGRIQITARFDRDMVIWFRSQGRSYQARMNAVLRGFDDAMTRR